MTERSLGNVRPLHGFLFPVSMSWFVSLASSGPSVERICLWKANPGHSFRGSSIGEPIIFQAKRPLKGILGYACFESYLETSLELLWALIGRGTGARSLAEMVREASRIPGVHVTKNGRVGAIVMINPIWLRRSVAAPQSWRPHLARGKRYDLTQGEGLALWNELTREGHCCESGD